MIMGLVFLAALLGVLAPVERLTRPPLRSAPSLLRGRRGLPPTAPAILLPLTD
jgi:hypothetical protein